MLRRIERFALFFGVAGALVWAGVFRALDQFLILTLAAAVSIVSFRGLRILVWNFGVREGGKLDRRSQIGAVLRFATVALLPLVSLWLDNEQALALVAGFSVLPLALIAEGLVIFLPTSPPESHDGN